MYYQVDIMLSSKNKISHREYYTNIASAINKALITYGENIQHILVAKIPSKL